MDSVIIDYLISKGYAPCDYILSTGTQYIDTGFKPNQDTRIIMDVEGYSITSTSQAFGARYSSEYECLGVFYDGQYKIWTVDYGYIYNRQNFDGIGPNKRLYIDYNKNVTTINNVTINNRYEQFNPLCNLVLLACNTAGTISGYMKAYLYSCKIYDNDTLIRDYVPAKDSSGYFGLYDLVNDKFYRSAAGNNFEGYLISRGVQYARNFRRRLLLESNSTPISISWTTQKGSWTEESNSSAIDGKQFTSVSPGGNGSTILRCIFRGITSITFNCVSNGERNYDYLNVGKLDSTCTRNSYGTTLKGKSGTTKDITFSCDSDTHYVEFCYSKDGSVNTLPDCATVYIKSYS